ncbi:MAG: chloride channel protein [bacterium]|nr:chloride channel protein [bacterium]
MKETAEHGMRCAKSFAIWALIAVLTGAVCGAVGTAFHLAVDWATEIRVEHGWLVYLLPVAGVAIAALYHVMKVDGVGTNHIIRSIRNGDHVPTPLVPVIFVATALTHLFGGSAGREGAALQIGGGLGCRIGKILKLDKHDMRTVTLCGMAAVFAALFATPVTATVFVLEVAAVGLLQYSALVPCLISAVTAYGVALLFGLSGSGYAPVVAAIDALTFGKVAVLAVLIALMSIIECVTLHKTEHLAAKIRSRYLRAAVGGVVIIALTLALGTRDYNGAGGDVIARALGGSADPMAFAWKLVFTAVTIGFGFKGGEIVPTFFIGAALGCVLAPVLGLPAELASALGLVGLFCGAVNCPIASIFLSIELFGAGALPYFALVCGMAYMLSGHFSLYEGAQRIVFSKVKWEDEK